MRVTGDVTGIDVPKVTAWLVRNIAGATAPFDFRIIAGGRSNLTFTVTDADGNDVRPAATADRGGAGNRPRHGAGVPDHLRGRSHRRAGSPCARCLYATPQVNGAPFYVMGYVDGVVLDSPRAGHADGGRDHGAAAGEHLIDVLADLHAVDIDAIGLGDLARREGYIERQVKRWTTQWEKSKTRELPAIDEVASPAGSADARRRSASRSRTATIGSATAWSTPRRAGSPPCSTGSCARSAIRWPTSATSASTGRTRVHEQVRPNDPTGIEGFPTYDELLERYATRTGRDLSEIDYYRAFSSWRLAVISEGVYARFLHGAMGDQQIDDDTLDGFKTGTETPRRGGTRRDALTGD